MQLYNPTHAAVANMRYYAAHSTRFYRLDILLRITDKIIMIIVFVLEFNTFIISFHALNIQIYALNIQLHAFNIQFNDNNI